MTLFKRCCSLIARPIAPLLYRLVCVLLNHVSDERTYHYESDEIRVDPPHDLTEDELTSFAMQQLSALIVLVPVLWIGALVAASAASGTQAPIISLVFVIAVLIWCVLLIGLDGAPVKNHVEGVDQ